MEERGPHGRRKAKSLPLQKYETFLEQLASLRESTNIILNTEKPGSEEKEVNLFKELCISFEQRKNFLQSCRRDLSKDIKELESSISEDQPISSDKHLKQLVLKNKILFKKFVEAAMSEENSYRQEAMMVFQSKYIQYPNVDSNQ